MSFFHRKKKPDVEAFPVQVAVTPDVVVAVASKDRVENAPVKTVPAVKAPAAAVKAPAAAVKAPAAVKVEAPVSSSLYPPTEVWLKGVAAHQELLPKVGSVVRVELMPHTRGQIISVLLDGERVGEFDYSTDLHHVLLGMRVAGLPYVVLNATVREGDTVPRCLVLMVPHHSEYQTEALTSWAPANSVVYIHKTIHYQEALKSLQRESTRMRATEVTFREHVGGIHAGKIEGVVSLDGQIIGELSLRADERWQIILSDKRVGIPGKLMVRIYGGSVPEGYTGTKDPNLYTVAAEYRRQAPMK